MINTGITTISSSYVQPNIITISNNNKDEVLKINPNGEIYYKVDDNMIKVNCADDVGEAFSTVVFNLSGLSTEDYMIEKYIDKIIKHEKSNEYISKLECAFRKMKLEKLKKI
jgi:hypothetical protein